MGLRRAWVRWVGVEVGLRGVEVGQRSCNMGWWGVFVRMGGICGGWVRGVCRFEVVGCGGVDYWGCLRRRRSRCCCCDWNCGGSDLFSDVLVTDLTDEHHL